MSLHKTDDEIFLPVVLRKSIINYYLAGAVVGVELRAGMEHALALEEVANSRLRWRTYVATGRGHAFLDDSSRSLCGANSRNECSPIVMSVICSICNELERPFR